MTTVEYRCPECGGVTETQVRADRLDRCRNDGCPGVPRRVWAVGLLRESIRAVPKGS